MSRTPRSQTLHWAWHCGVVCIEHGTHGVRPENMYLAQIFVFSGFLVGLFHKNLKWKVLRAVLFLNGKCYEIFDLCIFVWESFEFTKKKFYFSSVIQFEVFDDCKYCNSSCCVPIFLFNIIFNDLCDIKNIVANSFIVYQRPKYTQKNFNSINQTTGFEPTSLFDSLTTVLSFLSPLPLSITGW